MARQTLVFLLLCFVCTVMGIEQGARRPNPCRQGMAAMHVYYGERSCGGTDDPFREFHSRLHSMEYLSVDSLEHLLTNYCSSVRPRIVQCFIQNIQNCPADDREFLTQTVNQTAFVCQPNSDQVHPYVSELVSRLTDADLAGNGECYQDDESTYEMYHTCFREAKTSIGISADRSLSKQVEKFTVKQLVPKVQQFERTIFECRMRHFRENPNRCPNWRGRALMDMQYSFFPTPLGNKMTFTREEVLRMFEYEV